MAYSGKRSQLEMQSVAQEFIKEATDFSFMLFAPALPATLDVR